MNHLPSALYRPRHAVLGVLALFVIGCSAPAGAPSAAPASGPISIPPVATPTSAAASESPGPTGSPSAARWVAAGSMLAERVGFDTVLLGDGTVLAVGNDYACYPGPAGEGSETAERYDPMADAWTKTASLNKGRKLPATVTLGDGSAMVIGGVNTTGDAFSSTKIFTPSTGQWTDGSLLGVARGEPLAATLADGHVLVVSQVLPEDMAHATTGELYDPAEQAWSKAASPKSSNFDQLVPMADGRILGVGKLGDGRTFEIYDPANDVWTMLDNDPAFFGDTYVPMHDSSVLTIGIVEGGGMRVGAPGPGNGHVGARRAGAHDS